MNLFRLLKPRPTISDQELTTGLRWLTLEGTFSLGFNSITTSGFLAAFALALGANNLQIGILGASQGIIQGAAETGADLGEATSQTIEAVRKVAAHIGLSEKAAVAKAAEGALLAAEAIGPEAVAEVAESLPEEILAANAKEVEY